MYTITFTHWVQSPLHKKKDINVYSCIFNGPVNAVACNTQIYTRNVFHYSVIHTANESHSQSYTLCDGHAVSNAYTIFFYSISVFFYIFMNFFMRIPSYFFFFQWWITFVKEDCYKFYLPASVIDLNCVNDVFTFHCIMD